MFGQNTNVIVTILLRLSLHQAQLGVSLPGVPLDPLLDVLPQVLQADVVDDVAGSDQKRDSVALQELEVVVVSLVPEEVLHRVCNKNKV